MGRQTPVAMTDADEQEFLAFLRSTADIQLFESPAPSPELMIVDDFAPRELGHWGYLIWNQAFPWTPEYGQVAGGAGVRDRVGWFFLRNSVNAPLLEYTRHNFSVTHGLTGRVYWAKDFASPGQLPYDTLAFSRWFDQVVRWIRKRGRRQGRKAYEPYFMPDAWSRYRRAAGP